MDAPINSIYQILDKTTDGKMDVSDIKEDDYENNSADFHSFETVYNPAAEIKVLFLNIKKNFVNLNANLQKSNFAQFP